jgi:outer membrane receptor for ferrienterochelin and colicins
MISLYSDTTDGLLVFGNLNRVRSTGIELEAEGSTGPVAARASYALQHVRDVEQDLAPVNSPQHVGRVGVSVGMLRDRAHVSGEFRFLGSRRTVLGGRVPPYGLVNLTLIGQPINRGLELSASIYNLLDRHYADPGGEELAQELIVQDGRVVRFGARYQF